MKKNYRIYSDSETAEKKHHQENKDTDTREVSAPQIGHSVYGMSAVKDPMTSGKIYSMY